MNPRGKFGPRRGRRHQGVDLPLATGTPIYATFNGKVRVSSTMKGYGNIVIIRHEKRDFDMRMKFCRLQKKMGNIIRTAKKLIVIN